MLAVSSKILYVHSVRIVHHVCWRRSVGKSMHVAERLRLLCMRLYIVERRPDTSAVTICFAVGSRSWQLPRPNVLSMYCAHFDTFSRGRSSGSDPGCRKCPTYRYSCCLHASVGQQSDKLGCMSLAIYWTSLAGRLTWLHRGLEALNLEHVPGMSGSLGCGNFATAQQSYSALEVPSSVMQQLCQAWH